MTPGAPLRQRGPVAWMVHNRVTPNLLMLVLLLGGLFMSLQIKKEVFPEFTLDQVTVSVPYPGASPEEVEQGIVLALEEAVRGVDGIEELTATAAEGSARLSAELAGDADPMRVYQDIQQQVDAVTTLPVDAEQPQVALASRRREVLEIQVYGQTDQGALRAVTEAVRDRLLQHPGITQVELFGAQDYEVQVEVDQALLRRYGLSLDNISRTLAAAAVELPGGSIETRGGEILLRVAERRDWAREFALLPVVTTPEGATLRLGDVARVRDGFADSSRAYAYNSLPSLGIEVFRVGDQTPIGVSEAVRSVLAELEPELPEGVSLAINRDMSEIYQQRLELLLKNAFIGLLLVLVLLGLFLEFKLAFWVTMGIPTAFLGSFLFLPFLDVSINMVSMFAFIIALGIVVDDAIVAGENIYEYRQRGMDFITAAIEGARGVAVPITFSILTNIIAFMPLYFVPGFLGKLFMVTPLVVSTVFLISLVESLFILPAHLAHANPHHGNPLSRFLYTRQQRISAGLSRFVERRFRPLLEACLSYRYLTVAIGLALFCVVMAYAMSGRLGFSLMPRVESDRAVVTALLPVGSPLDKAEVVRDRLLATAREVAAGAGGAALVEGYRAWIEAHEVGVLVYLTDENSRPISTSEYTRRWRQATGAILGLESLRFESDSGGPGRGAALTVELSHRDVATLDAASARLAELLGEFPNVGDIQDGFTPGKQQLSFTLRPEGLSLGLTAEEVARQVRYAFYGAEALRQQRGRNEVTVRVRLPEAQRSREYDLEHLLIRTPDGGYTPLRQVAEVSRGRAYTSITRRDGRRTVTVTANVEPINQTNRIINTLSAELLPQLVQDYPGLSAGFRGRQQDTQDSLDSLLTSSIVALLALYAMLAIPFRSYAQPLLVMVAIPFGIVGAVLGHWLMGFGLSIISLQGIIALSGVVVNDSLVLIDYANRQRRAGLNPHEAIAAAAVRRFRPILLTTLTTFGGLAPMIFETSRQARFMIPMAISLGYGIVFATVISLVLVPCLYLILEDVLRERTAPGKRPAEGRLP